MCHGIDNLNKSARPRTVRYASDKNAGDVTKLHAHRAIKYAIYVRPDETPCICISMQIENIIGCN